MGISNLTGTPWHIETIHRKDGDEKRHKSRCEHYSPFSKRCLKKGKCIGSAHCPTYKPLSEDEFKERQHDTAFIKKRLSKGYTWTQAERLLRQEKEGHTDMIFNPGLEIGQEISNAILVSIFKCGNMGGMRRSHTTGTLVLISDYTKGLYHDKWIGGVLHYTGMGKNGNQDIHWAQNDTLAKWGSNDVDVHLFEVMEEGKYTYCGRIEMVGKPYTETQPGEDGKNRLVWMFPIRPVPMNDVKKPAMFVFKDMDDYKARGKNVDAEYNKTHIKKSRKSTGKSDIRRVKHKTFGEGAVIDIKDGFIIVNFEKAGRKQLNYKMCMDKGLIEFL